MVDEPSALSEGGVFNVAGVAGFWGWGGLWSPLVSGEQTGGAYSVLEQLMPAGTGPPPHVHEQTDEIFYILEGQVRVQIRDELHLGSAGDLVRVARGTPHGFAVGSDGARFLNLYVPAALDLMIAMLSQPATATMLPPAGAEKPPSEKQTQAFLERVRDLSTQSWSGQTDLLTEYRPRGGVGGPGGPQA